MNNPEKPGAFQQRLGLFDATMLVAGSMIGSGIFIVSADITRSVGSTGWLLAIWILTGIITVMGALSYAELAAMMPRAGGQYVYLREAFGPLSGFLYGWTFFLVIQTGFIAAVSVAFAKYLGVLVPALGTDNPLWTYDLKAAGWGVDLYFPAPWLKEQDWPVFFKREKFAISAGQLVAVAVAVVLTFINTLGVQAGKLVQNTFTVTKLLSLALLILVGLTVARNPETLANNFSNLWDGIWTTSHFDSVSTLVPFPALAAAMVIAAAMVGSLFSSDSWNNVTFTAGETKDPKRNLPRSLALGTVIVTGLYVLANLAYLAVLPVQNAGSEKLAVTIEQSREADRALAKIEADIRELQARIADQELLNKIGNEEIVRAELNQQPDRAQSLTAERTRREKVIASARSTMSDLQPDLERTRQRANKLRGELTIARGIAYPTDDRIGTAVLEQWSPNLGVPLMAIAIMISTFGCVNGLVLAGPRLYYAMAQDGVFFKSVGQLNARGVPAAGLVLQCAWSIVLVFSGTYSDLLDYTIFAALLFYALTVTGLFVLRRTQPNAERPYKAIAYPIMPALYVIACTIIMLVLLIVKPVYSWPSFLIVLAGIPVFFMWRGRRTRTP